jgi:beta-glucanase (GH16 family)
MIRSFWKAVSATLVVTGLTVGACSGDEADGGGGPAGAYGSDAATGGKAAAGGTSGAAGAGGATGGAAGGLLGSGGAPAIDGGCAPGEIGTLPNCYSAPPIAPGSGKTWKVTFSEEFSGTDYDHAKLSPCFDWNSGACTDSFNSGREHYDPGQVRVSDGTAKLVAEPLSPTLSSSGCYQGQCTYKSGLLSTCRPNANSGTPYLYAFTYGYVDARMKFPGTQGFFTAFWMLPADPTFAYRSEIDIVEILGDDPATIFMTYHYNNRSQHHAVNTGKGNNGACAAKDYSTDFHDFGVDWQADHVAWYIDGQKCDEFKGTSTEIENGPMQIILDLMVDHSWQQQWGVMLKDTTLVRQIEVDYLRVYQQVP